MSDPFRLTLVGSDGLQTSVISHTTYDAVGHVHTRYFANGSYSYTDYSWNSSTGLLDDVKTWEWLSGGWGVPQGSGYRHVDQDSGRLREIADWHNWLTPSGGSGQVESMCYQYDGQNRLTASWTIMWDTHICSQGAPSSTDTFWEDSGKPYSMRWSYTSAGLLHTVESDQVGGGTVTSTYAYADSSHPNGVTSITRNDGVNTPTVDTFAYDAAGRLTSRSVVGSSTTLAWDVVSRLVKQDGAGGKVLFLYDADGQRVARIAVDDASATAFLGATELTDPDTASGHTGDVTGVRTYTFAGNVVALRDGSVTDLSVSPKVTGIQYVFADEQGSVRATMSDPRKTSYGTDSYAATYTQEAYLPFGQVRGADELTATDKGWLGQVVDGSATASDSTGLVYLNARYYDPASSRFASPDPVVKTSDPRTLDAYVYARYNPINFADASGKMPIFNPDRAAAVARELSALPVTTSVYVGKGKTMTYGSLFIEQDPVGSRIILNFRSHGDGRGPSSDIRTVTNRSRLSWVYDPQTGVLTLRLNPSCDVGFLGKCHAPITPKWSIGLDEGPEIDTNTQWFNFASGISGDTCASIGPLCRPASDAVIRFHGKNSATGWAWGTPYLDAQIRIKWNDDGTVWTGVYGDNFPSAEAYAVHPPEWGWHPPEGTYSTPGGDYITRILYDDASTRDPTYDLTFHKRGGGLGVSGVA